MSKRTIERSARPMKRIKLSEQINLLPADEFAEMYLKNLDLQSEASSDRTSVRLSEARKDSRNGLRGEELPNIDHRASAPRTMCMTPEIEHYTARSISTEDLQACFSLIEQTSKDDYQSSSRGWHPKEKLLEMQDEHMHYLIVKSRCVKGFLSFMITDDSLPLVPVSYIYEIHLAEDSRGLGLGKRLFAICESIAREVNVEKVMLTCFVSNTNAAGFYASLGYTKDPVSPEDRQTRRKIVPADYVILSKKV